MTIYAIHHVTHFTYVHEMSFARCNLRLEPIAWPGQRVISHEILVSPTGQLTKAIIHAGLVNLTRLRLEHPTVTLDITSVARIAVDRDVPQIGGDDPSIAAVAAAARASFETGDAAPANFLYPSPLIAPDADIATWCGETLTPDRPVVEAAFALAQRIMREFSFDPDATRTETRPAEAFAKRAGVCQDFAQIMICGLRAAGLPAASVSGYIRTIPPPGGERLQGADAMHGWVLLWCGAARGWIGFDPTNGIFMAQDHVIVAIGRDYRDIAPVDGIFNGYGTREMNVAVDMVAV